MPDNAETSAVQMDYSDLLMAIVNGDAVYLDDPMGAMIGYFFVDRIEPLVRGLNVGRDMDMITGHPDGPWLHWSNLDWFEGKWDTERGRESAPGGNLVTLIKRVAERTLNEVRDRSGRRIGYLFDSREKDCRDAINTALGFDPTVQHTIQLCNTTTERRQGNGNHE